MNTFLYPNTDTLYVQVGGTPIRLAPMRDERWTQALKYTLTNLKICQLWLIERQAAGSRDGDT